MSQPIKYSEMWDRLEPYARRMLENIAQPKKTGGGGSAEPYAIILYDSDQQKIKYYSVTDAGLAGACAAAGSGDTIWLPACTIPGDHVLAAGVVMVGLGRKKTILTGKLTLGDGASVEKMRISRTGSASATAVVGPSSGVAYVINCDISVVLTGGTPLAVGTMGGNVQILYSTIICTLNGAAVNPFANVGDPSLWDFNADAEGWVFDNLGGNLVGLWSGGKITWYSSSGWAGGYWRYTFFNPPVMHTNSYITFDFTTQAGNYYVKFDVYVLLVSGRYTNFRFNDIIASGSYQFNLPDLVNLGYGDETTEGARIIYIQWTADLGVHDTAGIQTLDNVQLIFIDVVVGEVSVYGCVMDNAFGVSLEGDRAVFDATNYPLLHTNDADASPTALHHSLGTGANQAAAGNHGHSHTALTDIGTNTHAQIDTHLASTANPHSVTKAQVGLGSVANILDKLDAITAPTINDDSGDGYSVGSLWVDTVGDQTYICVDATVGAAVWVGTSGTDTNAIHDNVSGEIAAVLEKVTPVDADVVLIEDSAATNAKKKLSWANIKATLKTYFDTLYAIAAKGVTNGDAHDHSGGDGAQINHTGLANIGTNTHAQIDTFISGLGIWTSYTPTFTGFSVDPVMTFRYCIINKICIVIGGASGAAGTSNATTFTITPPVNPASSNPVVYFSARVQDNGINLATPGMVRAIPGGNIQIWKDFAGGAFTASGGKTAWFTVYYEI